MFREMRRSKQQLSPDEAVAILERNTAGVLAVSGDDGYPYAVPLSYVYADGKIYFHSGMTGHKVDALRRCPKASYCVYDAGYREEGSWANNVRSVIVFGKIEFVGDRETVYRIAAALSRRFTADEEYIRREIENSGPRTLMFALVPEHMTGKLVNES